MGRMAVNPLAAAAVSRAVSIVPRRRRRYIMESDPGPTDRPMDQARAEKGREGGTENTDVNCIPSRGKSQFCLESAMSEATNEAKFFQERAIIGARSWQCKSFSLPAR